MDSRFRIKTIACTPQPQRTIYAALHQCYSPNFVCDEQWPSEEKCGEIIVNRLLTGDKGHYSPLEVASITFACGGFPHDLVQQLTRHRHLSFGVQSFRYTGEQVAEVVRGDRDIEDIFYLRPVGEYTDRQGKRYLYSEDIRAMDKAGCKQIAYDYAAALQLGLSEEHARWMLPYALRQHFVMSGNARALMHLFDNRMKRDAQLEAQWFCDLLFQRFQEWVPALAQWYLKNRAHKGRLAP